MLRICSRLWAVFCLIFICTILSCINGEEKKESTILRQLATCELQTLKLGSDLADIINSPLGSESWSERVNQDFVIERLGFAPFASKGVRGSGLTLTKSNAKELHENGNWSGKAVEDSPYAVLNHKWIYMLGDSTTRQIWASFAAPFQVNTFERNAKEWVRQYCSGQKNRVTHGKFGTFPEEGWSGPCGKNEVTCHISGYGSEGLLSLDWKHFPYEDYDEWLWSENGPWKTALEEKRPDILTVQFGLHSCWHAHNFINDDLKTANTSMIERHIGDIPKLMRSIRQAIERPGDNRTRIVVVVTSGSSGVEKGSFVDECIIRFNRATADEAHRQGFAVLERGEIEGRLLLKSRGARNPLIAQGMHLSQPAQSIVATCLLRLLTCLETVGFDIYSQEIPALLKITANTQPVDQPILFVPP